MHYFHSSSTQRAKAFTLLEIVIVVALIVALAAIFLPVFLRARDNHPHSSRCPSNLKQIALGIMQYVQDYQGHYPLRQQGGKRSTGWAAMLQPYVKSTQLFQCSSESTPPDPDPASSGYCDYFYNSNLGPQSGGRFDKNLDEPSLTIMLGDAASSSSGNSSNGGTITTAGPQAIDGTVAGLAVAQGQWNPAVSGMRHLEGANYGFADGHVKWMKPERVTRNSTSAGNPTFRWSDKRQTDSGS